MPDSRDVPTHRGKGFEGRWVRPWQAGHRGSPRGRVAGAESEGEERTEPEPGPRRGLYLRQSMVDIATDKDIEELRAGSRRVDDVVASLIARVEHEREENRRLSGQVGELSRELTLRSFTRDQTFHYVDRLHEAEAALHDALKVRIFSDESDASDWIARHPCVQRIQRWQQADEERKEARS